VAFCPECKHEWDEGTALCPICGKDLEYEVESLPMVVIGTIADKFSADFARETLATYEIPVAIISKSGFLGTAGLVLTQFYSGTQALYEVSVPPSQVEEADELLRMTIGEKWQRKES
jgi:hypothetical protein